MEDWEANGGPCCSHQRVISKPREHDDGSKSDRWVCDSCGEEFTRLAQRDEARTSEKYWRDRFEAKQRELSQVAQAAHDAVDGHPVDCVCVACCHRRAAKQWQIRAEEAEAALPSAALVDAARAVCSYDWEGLPQETMALGYREAVDAIGSLEDALGEKPREDPDAGPDDTAGGNGFSVRDLDHHGEIELRLHIDNHHASCWLSREMWQAVAEKAGWVEAETSPEPSGDPVLDAALQYKSEGLSKFNTLKAVKTEMCCGLLEAKRAVRKAWEGT